MSGPAARRARFWRRWSSKARSVSRASITFAFGPAILHNATSVAVQVESKVGDDVRRGVIARRRFGTRWTTARGAFVGMFLLLLAATRLSHLVGEIDEPHGWRQADTAYYAYAFHEDGIDLLRPSVCWMGAHRTFIFEFPLHEAFVAVAYNLFGYDLLWARLVTLAFFLGATLYFFLIVGELQGETTALVSTLIYASFPLAQFYSRAVHVDFAAVFFAHASTYHLLASTRGKSVRLVPWILGVAAGVVAFLIKAPYHFYFLFVLLAVPSTLARVRRDVWYASAFAVCVVVFLVWRRHVGAVNEAIPDWSFIQGYDRHDTSGAWYFGNLSMRIDPVVWFGLARRLVKEVVGYIGLPAAVWGTFLICRRALHSGALHERVIVAWGLGVAAYWLIFTNLNHIHNYYQIPFLAIFAILIAVGSKDAVERISRRSTAAAALAAGVWGVLLLASYCWRAEREYYHGDFARGEAARLIREHTPEHSLVVAAVEMPPVDWHDPRLLGRADRAGWSVSQSDLTPTNVPKFKRIGANYLAVLATTVPDLTSLATQEVISYPVENGRWWLTLARL